MPTGRRHILIVDAELASQRLVERVVTAGVPGARVTCKGDGVQALQVLEREPVDLLIVDPTTSAMGAELLRQVLDRKVLPPVVVVTAQGSRATIAGWASECFEKPLQPEPFVRCVRELLEPAARRSYLEGVSIAGFVQLLGMEGKTCTLRASVPGAQGVLFFQAGQLVDAWQGELRGAAAALEIFSWKHPTLTLESLVRERQTTIHAGLTELLLESARLVDERDRHQRRGGSHGGLSLVQQADEDSIGDPEFAGWPAAGELFAEPAPARQPAGVSRPAPVLVVPPVGPPSAPDVPASPPGAVAASDYFELVDRARDLMRVADFAEARMLLLRALDLRPGDRMIQQNLRVLARRCGE